MHFPLSIIFRPEETDEVSVIPQILYERRSASQQNPQLGSNFLVTLSQKLSPLLKCRPGSIGVREIDCSGAALAKSI